MNPTPVSILFTLSFSTVTPLCQSAYWRTANISIQFKTRKRAGRGQEPRAVRGDRRTKRNNLPTPRRATPGSPTDIIQFGRPQRARACEPPERDQTSLPFHPVIPKPWVPAAYQQTSIACSLWRLCPPLFVGHPAAELSPSEPTCWHTAGLAGRRSPYALCPLPRKGRPQTAIFGSRERHRCAGRWSGIHQLKPEW